MGTTLESMLLRYQVLDNELNEVLAHGVIPPVSLAWKNDTGVQPAAAHPTAVGGNTVRTNNSVLTRPLSTGNNDASESSKRPADLRNLGKDDDLIITKSRRIGDSHPRPSGPRPRPHHSNDSAPADDDKDSKPTRTPKRTNVCGKIIAKPKDAHVYIPCKGWDKSGWRFKCVICKDVFKYHISLFEHFPKCVGMRGNVDGAHWYDDDSIVIDDLSDNLLEQVSTEDYYNASEC